MEDLSKAYGIDPNEIGPTVPEVKKEAVKVPEKSAEPVQNSLPENGEVNI